MAPLQPLNSSSSEHRYLSPTRNGKQSVVWGEGCIVPGEFIVVEFDGRARREDGRVVNMPGFDLVAESDSSMKQRTPVSPKASEAKLRVLEMAE